MVRAILTRRKQQGGPNGSDSRAHSGLIESSAFDHIDVKYHHCCAVIIVIVHHHAVQQSLRKEGESAQEVTKDFRARIHQEEGSEIPLLELEEFVSMELE